MHQRRWGLQNLVKALVLYCTLLDKWQHLSTLSFSLTTFSKGLIKYKVTPAEFAHKKERWVTAFIWMFPLFGGLEGLVKGFFNPGKNESLCVMVEKPLRCAIDSNTFVDCIRGRNAAIASFFLDILPILFCFAMLVINLVRFTVHVYWQENLFKPRQELRNQGYWERLKAAATIGCTHTNTSAFDTATGGQGSVDGTHTIRNTSTFDTTTSGQDPVVIESASDVEIVQDEEALASSLTMQSFVQSSLYISAFTLCFIGPGTAIIMGALLIPTPDWLFWMTSAVWPLGGFFNILIYTRPKVLQYQKTNPQYSRPYIFLVVVLSGGEVPTEIEIDSGDSSDNDFEEKADVLKHIMRNILDYRANIANDEEMDTAERKPVTSSTPSDGVSNISIDGPSSSCQNRRAIAWVNRDDIESQVSSQMSCMAES